MTKNILHVQLNDEQERAVQAMLDHVRKNSRRYAGDCDDWLDGGGSATKDEALRRCFLLLGYAGTGKTTALQHFLTRLRGDSIGGRLKVAVSAPTHKACKVAGRMARDYGIAVECRTIQSMLGLTVKRRGDREVLERAMDMRRAPIAEHDVVVVDECSMVGTDLFGHIMEAARVLRTVFIFVGDPAQLPPVGEDISPTMARMPTMARAGIRWATLAQVMRQRGENPILAACTDIREALLVGRVGAIPPIVPALAADESCGVSVLTGDLWLKWMPSAFSSGQFDADTDRFRVIAWRNERVAELNGLIHRMRYPDRDGSDGPFAEGEPVVFARPCYRAALVWREHDDLSCDIAIPNDLEGIVDGCVRTRTRWPEITCWEVHIVLETGEEVIVAALDDEGERIRDAAMREIANRNKALAAQGRKGDWLPYYELKDAFADVRPAYAMTAHKSQGSTFENVFVDVLDIFRNRDRAEAMRCLYVACSRASHHLILNATGAFVAAPFAIAAQTEED